MRFPSLILVMVLAAALSGCDFWPRELDTLAQSVARQVSGETTVWRVGGDVVVIDVAGSPLYGGSDADLEAAARDIAGQAVAASVEPLESIAVTFHESEVSDDPGTMREFIFLVREGRPELQPQIDFDATGPLKPEAFRPSLERLEKTMTAEQVDCVRREVEARARAAGDPETLDPATVELLPADHWKTLDAPGKRIILVQAIATSASFYCIGARRDGTNSG